MIPYFFYGSGMYRKHPNHTYGRNRNDSANNRANILYTFWMEKGNIFLFFLFHLHCSFCWLYKDKWVADPIWCFFIERVASKIAAKISNGFFLPLLVLVPNLRFNLPWNPRCTKYRYVLNFKLRADFSDNGHYIFLKMA